MNDSTQFPLKTQQLNIKQNLSHKINPFLSPLLRPSSSFQKFDLKPDQSQLTLKLQGLPPQIPRKPKVLKKMGGNVSQKVQEFLQKKEQQLNGEPLVRDPTERDMIEEQKISKFMAKRTGVNQALIMKNTLQQPKDFVQYTVNSTISSFSEFSNEYQGNVEVKSPTIERRNEVLVTKAETPKVKPSMFAPMSGRGVKRENMVLKVGKLSPPPHRKLLINKIGQSMEIMDETQQSQLLENRRQHLISRLSDIQVGSVRKKHSDKTLSIIKDPSLPKQLPLKLNISVKKPQTNEIFSRQYTESSISNQKFESSGQVDLKSKKCDKEDTFDTKDQQQNMEILNQSDTLKDKILDDHLISRDEDFSITKGAVPSLYYSQAGVNLQRDYFDWAVKQEQLKQESEYFTHKLLSRHKPSKYSYIDLQFLRQQSPKRNLNSSNEVFEKYITMKDMKGYGVKKGMHRKTLSEEQIVELVVKKAGKGSMIIDKIIQTMQERNKL